jgi:hypothetical protein
VGLSVVGSYDGGLGVMLGFTAVDLDLWCPATQSRNVSAFHHAARRHGEAISRAVHQLLEPNPSSRLARVRVWSRFPPQVHPSAAYSCITDR